MKSKRKKSGSHWMLVTDASGLRMARERRGFTQRELAYLCGVSQTTIWMLESGTMKTLSHKLGLMLAKRLDIPYQMVFEDKAMPTATNGQVSNSQSEAVAT